MRKIRQATLFKFSKGSAAKVSYPTQEKFVLP